MNKDVINLISSFSKGLKDDGKILALFMIAISDLLIEKEVVKFEDLEKTLQSYVELAKKIEL